MYVITREGCANKRVTGVFLKIFVCVDSTCLRILNECIGMLKHCNIIQHYLLIFCMHNVGVDNKIVQNLMIPF